MKLLNVPGRPYKTDRPSAGATPSINHSGSGSESSSGKVRSRNEPPGSRGGSFTMSSPDADGGRYGFAAHPSQSGFDAWSCRVSTSRSRAQPWQNVTHRVGGSE